MDGIIRSAALRGLARLCETIELDHIGAAAELGIPPQAFTDPDLRVHRRAMIQLVSSLAARSGLPDFGLRLSEFRSLDDWGLLGLAARDQATFRGFLRTLTGNLNYYNSGATMRLRSAGEMVELVMDFDGIDPELARHSTECSMGYLVRWIRMVLNPDWAPAYAAFHHRSPPSMATHRRLIGVEPMFEQEAFRLGFPRSDLERQIRGAQPELAATSEELLRDAGELKRMSYSETVRRNLRALIGRADFSAATMARLCGLTPRSLQRKLAAERASYQTLLDEVRAEMAMAHVVGSQRPLAEVADILGFSSQSAFSHWYRACHGESAVTRRGRLSAAA